MLSLPQMKDSFWSRVQLDCLDGCWEWKGYTTPHGYGRLTMNGKRQQAHRWAWELYALPEVKQGQSLDHLCRNRVCVNPDHLEIVSLSVNSLRGEGFYAQNARKTHCVNGHEFTPENIMPKVTTCGSKLGRECRRCAYIRSRTYSIKRSARRRAEREASCRV